MSIDDDIKRIGEMQRIRDMRFRDTYTSRYESRPALHGKRTETHRTSYWEDKYNRERAKVERARAIAIGMMIVGYVMIMISLIFA